MNAMKWGNIEWAALSRYRGELMGIAILFVILFHVYLPRHDMFFGLRRMGSVGVDIFFLLSGIGLWFSWTKSESTSSDASCLPRWKQLIVFYVRRFLRVYPAWFVVACIYYGWDYMGARKDSTTLVDLFGDILINWDFWLHDELHFWYVPAIMILYLFAPFYMNLILRYPAFRWLPVLMIMWCVMVQWVGPVHQAVGHIEIFWSRLPIFFIGINLGAHVKAKETIVSSTWWLVIIVFAMSLGTCIYLEQVLHGRFPLFIERMLYIPLTITAVLLLAKLFEKLPSTVNGLLCFIGGLSLEIYLLHCQFFLLPLEKLHLGYWPTFLACTIITIPVAWLLQKVIGVVTKKIKL